MAAAHAVPWMYWCSGRKNRSVFCSSPGPEGALHSRVWKTRGGSHYPARFHYTLRVPQAPTGGLQGTGAESLTRPAPSLPCKRLDGPELCLLFPNRKRKFRSRIAQSKKPRASPAKTRIPGDLAGDEGDSTGIVKLNRCTGARRYTYH